MSKAEKFWIAVIGISIGIMIINFVLPLSLDVKRIVFRVDMVILLLSIYTLVIRNDSRIIGK
jgi:hypothetical protein